MWTSKTGNHQQEGLSKFGYISHMKVVIFKNPSIFWLLAGTCWRNLAILFHFISKSSYSSHIFLQNPLCLSKSYFWGWKMWEFAQNNNNANHHYNLQKDGKDWKTRCVFGVHELIIFTRTWLLNILIMNDHHNVAYLQSMFLFVNFVMEPKWWSSIGRFSQNLATS